MKSLNPEQKRKLLKITDVVKNGNVAVIELIFELEERLQEVKSEINRKMPDLEVVLKSVRGKQGETGEKGDKGDKGDRGNDGKDGLAGKDGRNGIDGKDGKNGRDGSDGRNGNDGKDGKDGAMGVIDVATIAYLEDEIKRLEELVARPIERNGRVIAPSRGVFLYMDGLKKGLVSNLNLVGGTNVSIAYSKVNGQDTATINASGGGPGGISVETPTGTVNAVNKVFGVSAEPQWIVADNTTYFDGAGYTYSAPNVTMDVAPSVSIRAIM